jgi:predicted nucleic-acid-binding protein
VRAIDTNIIVRFLARDDEGQAKRALAAITSGDVFVPTTVILETEWVIRRLYGFGPSQTAAAFRELAGLPGVTLEAPGVVAQALDWMQGGMDFADALHLGAAKDCAVFLTFDRKLAKVAEQQSTLQVAEP